MADYATQTVVNLKALLDQRSLVKTGKKAELIARLKEDDVRGASGAQHSSEQEQTSPVLDKTILQDESPKDENAKVLGAAAPVSPGGETREIEDDTNLTPDGPLLAEAHLSNALVSEAVQLAGSEAEKEAQGSVPQDLQGTSESVMTPQEDEVAQQDLKRPMIDSEPSPSAKRTKLDASNTPAEQERAPGELIEEISKAPDASPILESANTNELSHPQSHTEKSQNTVADAKHSVTEVLYIENLVRPIHEDELRKHLKHISQQSVEPELYLNALKTHAFVKFESKDSAARAREALHGQVWPAEAGRRSLNVDYVGGNEMMEFMEEEKAHPRTTRWHVRYLDGGSGPTAIHEKVHAGDSVSAVRSHDKEPDKRDRRRVVKLDELFKKTKSKPQLFYLHRRVYN